jgi:formylglycine-generating enzyme required for sulfatase activity
MHLLSRFSFSILMSVVVFSANHHVSFAQDATQPAPTTAPPAAEVKPADTTEVPEGMVLVTAGPFTMGSNSGEGLITNDATPQQMVTLPAFYIDKTEVTNAEYKKFCDATGNPVPPYWKDGIYAEGQAQVPVRWVNWWEAQAYAAWKGKRLPTEAEWEKAARGTDGRVYPWGNQRALRTSCGTRKGHSRLAPGQAALPRTVRWIWRATFSSGSMTGMTPIPIQMPRFLSSARRIKSFAAALSMARIWKPKPIIGP